MGSLDIIIPAICTLIGSGFTYLITSKQLGIKKNASLADNYGDLIVNLEKRITELEQANKELLPYREKVLKIEMILRVASDKDGLRFIKKMLDVEEI